MPAITKAELARRFGVDRAQATRWADKGMPVLPGGLVDAEAATRWVERNTDGSIREARQRQQHGHVPPGRRDQVEALDTLIRLGIAFMAQHTPAMVAHLAIEAGLSVEVARQLHDLSLIRAAEMADEVRDVWMGLPSWPNGPMRRVEGAAPVDWDALGVPKPARKRKGA